MKKKEKKNNPKKTNIALDPDVQDMLIKFQGDYMSENKERRSQSRIINDALRVYITKAYQLSKE